MGPDGNTSTAGAAEIKANQNRISTLLSAPVSSQSSRPRKYRLITIVSHIMLQNPK